MSGSYACCAITRLDPQKKHDAKLVSTVAVDWIEQQHGIVGKRLPELHALCRECVILKFTQERVSQQLLVGTCYCDLLCCIRFEFY